MAHCSIIGMDLGFVRRVVTATAIISLALGLTPYLSAQETRGTILGTIKDATGGVLPGVEVTVTNVGTNTTQRVLTNDSGAYEVPYLLPGMYDVSAQLTGFKRYVQHRIDLATNTRFALDIVLEAGNLSEEVNVTATASLLETTSASASSVLTNRQVMDLPVFGNSVLLLARSAPGIQWTGQPNYLGLHSNVGASAVSAAGGVGGTEFSIDGVPNSGGTRRAGYLPYSDTIAEVKIETSPFDASKGHTSGASVSMISKSGTNDYHGTLTWQHWQQRWNATQSPTNGAYWSAIRQAEGSGDTAQAARLRREQGQPSGRSNNWAASIGGPVRIPKLYNGRDKLFFFFSYNGFKDVKTEEGTAVNRTVPSAAHRRGDFSDLLTIDPVRYQIYDPRTARAQVINGTRYIVRDPFPNNQVPILNPIYQNYVNLYPLPNGNPRASREGNNNYLAAATPFNWDYKAFHNRVDYNISEKHKVFGRWSWNDFLEDRGDWTYQTARGLNSNGLNRRNIGITADYVYTINPTTLLNLSVAWNRFREGDVLNAKQLSGSPSAAGFPSYVDAKAGDQKLLPQINVDGYSGLTRTYPAFTRYTGDTLRAELSKVFGKHSIKTGFEGRMNYRSGGGGGNTSGSYTFGNGFTNTQERRIGSDGNPVPIQPNPANIGLAWAAFMLGVPAGYSIATNDTFYLTNPFYSGYIQDDFRITSKLWLNLGLRYEFEGGFRERFNRGVGPFDPTLELPIAAAAQAAYARNPIPDVPVSQFLIRGGSTYLGKNGVSPRINKGQPGWMPRLGFAYSLSSKTVIRGGYGMFYDTNNVLNDPTLLDQFGYSRSTSPVITTDNGLTFLNADLANGRTVLSDPFPVRSDGSRFETPTGSYLGAMARVGRGYGYADPDWKRARQHRWRFGVQRELNKNMAVEIAYLGSYSDQIRVGKLINPLPESIFTGGLLRNQANSDYWGNGNSIPNPFNISNFGFIRDIDPILYQDMSTNGFFTAQNTSRAALLRAYPHIGGITNNTLAQGQSKYHHMEVSLTRRFTQGYSYGVSYTWVSHQDRNFYENEFSDKPTWRPSNNSRPHHLNVNAIFELPFGPGKRFEVNNRFLRAIVGGWQVGAIYHLQSGRLIDLGNWFFYGDDLRTLKLKGNDQNTENWFDWRLFPGASRDYSASNRAAYEARIRQIVPAQYLPAGKTYETVVPADFQPAGFHRRVFPQRLNWLRGDYMNQLDANLIRNFRLTERTSFQMRVDLINALNRVQWDNPSTDLNSTNFGQVTQQYNTPRWIQFQARFIF